MSTHVIDSHVGKKIRELRNLAGVSQTKLAEALDVSFQQIQKYEIAANRVSASKLFEVSKFFNVPIGVFFPDQDERTGVSGINADEAGLVRAYREASPEIRTAIRSLTRSLGMEQDSSRSGNHEAQAE